MEWITKQEASWFVDFTRFYEGGENKNGGQNEIYSTGGENEKFVQKFGWKSWNKIDHSTDLWMDLRLLSKQTLPKYEVRIRSSGVPNLCNLQQCGRFFGSLQSYVHSVTDLAGKI